MPRHAPLVERVSSRVKLDQVSGCWTWTGSRTRRGYGHAHVGGGIRSAVHRIVYELVVGPIPDGLTLDHLCRNRACVNPAHLEPVTNHENILRGLIPSANRDRCKNDRHDLATVGIYVDSEGTQRCRACRLESKRRYVSKMARVA